VLLEEAVSCCTAREHVLPHIAALSALGASLRRRGRRSEARRYLAEAQHLAGEAGALAALRHAHEELLAAGGRPRRVATRGIDALTPAELRVARLAAEGHSNPEIAQLLFVTRRAVETHLTSVYGKLGVASRGQLSDALS
jgi:DNA-binding CsgD family transcriptional regulator